MLTSAHSLPHHEEYIRFAQKATATQSSIDIHDQWEFLTTNRTNFHELGAASPENFILGFIRVYS
jgi:hypothetical protein